MKSHIKMNQAIAMLAFGFALTAGSHGALARTIVRHSGNVVHTQLYDRAGKSVNRLPARAYGIAPKKATCKGGPLGNKCSVQTSQTSGTYTAAFSGSAATNAPTTATAFSTNALTFKSNARTFVIHSGNSVHPQLYDSAGKPVNRLPGRALGKSPKKVVCGLRGRTNFCQVI